MSGTSSLAEEATMRFAGQLALSIDLQSGSTPFQANHQLYETSHFSN
jgi:hypothetical protein